MALGVTAVVAVIVAFKAAGAWQGLLLPLGVSYYSFKLISYLIEVYWDDEAVERDPVLFFLFPAFFPQIVSGPIQRPEPFFAQMRDVTGRTLDAEQLETGFRLILGGLMMKLLVGDRLAGFIALIDQSHPYFSYSVVLTTVACYLLQLYADFAGYTNIALGIGKLFGIEGPPNFHAPFAAANIQEFWRRWHMSLTSWVTDYLFTPLSMSLRGLGQVGLVLCIMLNMLIIGLWHGLTLNYSRLRRLAGRSRLRHSTRRNQPQAPRTDPREVGPRRTDRHNRHAGASLDIGAGRHNADLRAHEFNHHLLALADLGSGRLHPDAGSCCLAKRALGLVGPAGVSHRSRLDLHGYRSICRRGRSRRQKVGGPDRRGCAELAAIRRLPVFAIDFVDRRIRPIRLWTILTG